MLEGIRCDSQELWNHKSSYLWCFKSIWFFEKGKTNDKHQEWQNREYFTFIAPYYEEILRFEKNRLIYSNVLVSKVKIHRNINGVINKMTIIKQGDKYYLIVLVRKMILNLVKQLRRL